jgi:hypothetical protein
MSGLKSLGRKRPISRGGITHINDALQQSHVAVQKSRYVMLMTALFDYS